MIRKLLNLVRVSNNYRNTPIVDDDFPEQQHYWISSLEDIKRSLEFKNEVPQIICLCGSTRFYDAFMQANYELTCKGHIVLSVGFYVNNTGVHGEGVECDDQLKVKLDDLHKRKIDLADEVLVLNINGYIGSSTRSEIEWAEKTGKPVKYLEPL